MSEEWQPHQFLQISVHQKGQVSILITFRCNNKHPQMSASSDKPQPFLTQSFVCILAGMASAPGCGLDPGPRVTHSQMRALWAVAASDKLTLRKLRAELGQRILPFLPTGTQSGPEAASVGSKDPLLLGIVSIANCRFDGRHFLICWPDCSSNFLPVHCVQMQPVSHLPQRP